MKLNLPNKITLARVIMIPVSMFFVINPVLGDLWSPIVALILFLATSLTDMVDGKIARSRNLVTDFGKFLDPLADKLLTFGGYLAVCVSQSAFRGSDCEAKIFYMVLGWCTFVIMFRELAVTSLRLVIAASPQKKVIAAAWPGKVKTTFQMITLEFLIIEPVFMKYLGLPLHNICSYVLLAITVALTIYSGVLYFIGYWEFLDPSK